MTTTANKSSPLELQTESCLKRPYSAISKHSSVKGTPTAIRDWLISLRRDFHVSPLALPVKAKQKTIRETSGLKRSMSFAEYDRDLRIWKTHQACLLENTFDEFTETWPKAGMTVDGDAFPQPNWELHIADNDGGVWPTPTVTGNYNRKGMSKNSGDGLATAVQKYPAPVASDHRNHGGPSTPAIQRRMSIGKSIELSMTVDGALNPQWVEWLMGWPPEWTALEPLEMDKFQRWQQQHSDYFHDPLIRTLQR